MIAQANTLDDVLQQIQSLTTIEDSNQVRNAMKAFKEQASPAEYETVRKALSLRVNELLDSLHSALADEAVLIDGKRYDLDQWLTIANYAKKYGVTTHVVTNDIRRGKIPTENVIELTRLNNIRMIKDQAYK